MTSCLRVRGQGIDSSKEGAQEAPSSFTASETVMPSQEPQFQNADNQLIWQELKHIREGLDKLNGQVAENTAHRTTCQERWRTHEKEHDKLGRDSSVKAIVSGVSAAVLSFLGIHLNG